MPTDKQDRRGAPKQRQLQIRLSESQRTWLRKQAFERDVSMQKIVEELIDAARGEA